MKCQQHRIMHLVILIKYSQIYKRDKYVWKAETTSLV